MCYCIYPVKQSMDYVNDEKYFNLRVKCRRLLRVRIPIIQKNNQPKSATRTSIVAHAMNKV